MTRFIHDQFSKDYLEELLKNYGEVQAPSRVAAEIKEIDVYFSPYHPVDSNLKILGLLGKMASTSAIFEPYRNPVTNDEILECIVKLVEVKSLLKREAKRNNTQLAENEIPKLWILTPTASVNRLTGFNATLKDDSLPGIYYLGKSFRTAIVVIHQLPPTAETLWIRMLGRGTVQKEAVDELIALPVDHPFRKITLELFYNLQTHLTQNHQESEDREIIMRLAPLFQQEKDLAIQKRESTLIIRLLNKRFGEINPELIERVKNLSIDKIESLGEALLDFSKVDDLEMWLNQN